MRFNPINYPWPSRPVFWVQTQASLGIFIVGRQDIKPNMAQIGCHYIHAHVRRMIVLRTLNTIEHYAEKVMIFASFSLSNNFLEENNRGALETKDM